MESSFVLFFLDMIFFSLHVIIILFNLTGWLWKRTLKLHLYVILATATSWFIIGIWYGFGYCFITDWHWQIKQKLGETDLPNSFITYFFEVINFPISPSIADSVSFERLCDRIDRKWNKEFYSMEKGEIKKLFTLIF